MSLSITCNGVSLCIYLADDLQFCVSAYFGYQVTAGLGAGVQIGNVVKEGYPFRGVPFLVFGRVYSANLLLLALTPACEDDTVTLNDA